MRIALLGLGLIGGSIVRALKEDPARAGAFADTPLTLVAWLPRDDVTTARRLAIGNMLAEAANARVLNWSMSLDDGVVAMVRYTLDLRDGGQMPDVEALDQRLARMVRGWVVEVESALGEKVPAPRAARLALKWANAFPPNYRNVSTPDEAADDILRLGALETADDRQVLLYPTVEGEVVVPMFVTFATTVRDSPSWIDEGAVTLTHLKEASAVADWRALWVLPILFLTGITFASLALIARSITDPF